MTISATATATKTRRVAAPGEVNVTNNDEARALLRTLAEQKKAESAGDKAKRERKGTSAKPGTEPRLREILGDGTHFVINGQSVAKVSSPRSIKTINYALLETLYPEAYAACVGSVEYDFLQIV